MSVKTQKLFLKSPNPDGFQGYALTEESAQSSDSGGESIRPFQIDAVSELSQSFGLPEVFWNWVKDDPEVSLQLEAIIEARVRDRLKIKETAAIEAAREKGRAEGIELGRADAKVAVEEELLRLDHLFESVMRQKSSLMLDHEKSWIAALGHLLKRFLVPGRELALSEIDIWMREGLSNFEEKGKVRLHLSDEDFRRLESIIHQLPHGNWELVKDNQLQPGEVRCETGSGGLFFSTQEEMNRLFETIDRFTARKTEDAA